MIGTYQNRKHMTDKHLVKYIINKSSFSEYVTDGTYYYSNSTFSRKS